jgi:hypothetical protein
MSKSKHRKNHKEKVQARNNRISNEKSREQKMQREFIMNLIKEEQGKGMFENTPSINGPIIDSTIIDTPIIEGPSI